MGKKFKFKENEKTKRLRKLAKNNKLENDVVITGGDENRSYRTLHNTKNGAADFSVLNDPLGLKFDTMAGGLRDKRVLIERGKSKTSKLHIDDKDKGIFMDTPTIPFRPETPSGITGKKRFKRDRKAENMALLASAGSQEDEEEQASQRMIASVNDAVNQKTMQAEEAAKIASTSEGRKVLQRIAAQSNLPSKQLDRINQQIKNNPEELINAQVRNMEAKEQGKPSSVKDSFMEIKSSLLVRVKSIPSHFA